MATEFIFACQGEDFRKLYRVRADNLEQAQHQLHLYCAVDDPYGREIRLEHIRQNFHLICQGRRFLDVTDTLNQWGLHDDAAEQRKSAESQD